MSTHGSHVPALSFVVPAHNSATVIEGTLKAVYDRLGDLPSEIVVVENGSSDATWALLQDVAASWPQGPVRLQVLQSAKGMGEALRSGILASSGQRVVLTADDLPFGFTDLDAADRLPAETMVIGSKAHPASVAGRGVLRGVLSKGFRALRWLLLRSTVRDPQGTFILQGDLARQLAPLARERGFLFTTELVALAERRGVKPVEVPVQLASDHHVHASRVSPADVGDMAKGLLRVRRSIRTL